MRDDTAAQTGQPPVSDETKPVDTALLARLLLHIEILANRDGWDQSAAVMVLYDWRDTETEMAYRQFMGITGDPVRSGDYAARPMLRPWKMAKALAKPSHALFRMALNLTQAPGAVPQADMFVDALAQPGFLGVAFVVESWGREFPDEETRDRESRLDFADLPGSVECRMVYAADRSGGFHVVKRLRGRRPELLDGSVFGGSVVESLRGITARVAGLPIPEFTEVPFRWEWPEQAATSP